MKNVVILMVLSACTQKYADYDLIRKVDFNQKSYERPIPVTQVMAQGDDQLEACFNQWLFFSNAEKQKNNAIPFVVRSLCPGQDYLVNAKMTETWWTSIILTRSCVEIEALCGTRRKKE